MILGNWIVEGTPMISTSSAIQWARQPKHQGEPAGEKHSNRGGVCLIGLLSVEAGESPLTVRRRRIAIGNQVEFPPLFSGAWHFTKYVRADPEVETRSFTTLHLWLNPTRYVSHQPPVTPLPDAERGSAWPAPIMFAPRARGDGVRGEVPLDGNDNWIPAGYRWGAFTKPVRWRRHLRTYLRGVTDTFTTELERINRPTPHATFYQPDQSLNLQTAETYWEFGSANPTALVATLRSLLSSFTAHERTVSERRQMLDTSIDGNALTLTAEINPGRSVRIYAKTNRRVRIEVIHKLGGRYGYALAGGHTATAWGALAPMLDDLAEDAAALVNRMFSHFRDQSEVTPSHITAFAFLLEIVHHSRSIDTATTMLSLLVFNGAIAAEGTGTQMQRALHRLSNEGVLEYDAVRGNMSSVERDGTHCKLSRGRATSHF